MVVQGSFDDFNWTISNKEPVSLEVARQDLAAMLDECDRCSFRATLNDERQEQCKICPYRIQMQEAMKDIEYLTSRVKAKRKAEKSSKIIR